MAYIPQLDNTGKRVLRVIRQRGVVAGWQLLTEASVDRDQLAETANRLVSLGLISTNGNISNSSEIHKAYFNILPSGVNFADLVLAAS